MIKYLAIVTRVGSIAIPPTEVLNPVGGEKSPGPAAVTPCTLYSYLVKGAERYTVQCNSMKHYRLKETIQYLLPISSTVKLVVFPGTKKFLPTI